MNCNFRKRKRRRNFTLSKVNKSKLPSAIATIRKAERNSVMSVNIYNLGKEFKHMTHPHWFKLASIVEPWFLHRNNIGQLLI